MNGYIDKNLIQNSLLACLLLTYFVKKYEKLNAGTENPDLMKILLVLPIVWHKESCTLINKKKTSTTFYTLLAENSIIKANFEKRLAEFNPISLQGLNLSVSANLLSRIEREEEIFLTSLFKRWPVGYTYKVAPTEMINSINRLAYWFKNHSTAELYLMLLGK
ncbi:three component ABC system middle component [Acinetobacter indicus]|uniref:three component ABC system middle component n=1 Tax=Acinetobacter indicus TaxID=756892 RepID=UPI003211FF71